MIVAGETLSWNTVFRLVNRIPDGRIIMTERLGSLIILATFFEAAPSLDNFDGGEINICGEPGNIYPLCSWVFRVAEIDHDATRQYPLTLHLSNFDKSICRDTKSHQGSPTFLSYGLHSTPWSCQCWDPNCCIGSYQIFNFPPVLQVIVTRYPSYNDGIVGIFKDGIGALSGYTFMDTIRLYWYTKVDCWDFCFSLNLLNELQAPDRTDCWFNPSSEERHLSSGCIVRVKQWNVNDRLILGHWVLPWAGRSLDRHNDGENNGMAILYNGRLNEITGSKKNC